MRMSFFRQTICVRRPGQKMERGSTVPDWDSAQTMEVTGCSVQPGETSLSQDGRVQAVSDRLTVYAPVTDIRAGDHIIVNGKEYEIDGEPKVWQSPSGRLNHMQLDLVRWRG